MALLVALFFITAVLYASVGFGGGSTYNALLVLHGVDYRILPSVALVCNIIVVSGGSWHFLKAGHISIKKLTPWIVTSVPAAWLGGILPISESVFVGALGASLLLAGAHLALEREQRGTSPIGESSVPVYVPVFCGLLIGFVSGLVGIGGGIFLAPVLYFLKWGTVREIAGACSLFILVNSVSGLSGQLMKAGEINVVMSLAQYWPHFLAVLIGGQIGSRLGTAWLKPIIVKRLTAVLILYVSGRLLLRWFSLVF